MEIRTAKLEHKKKIVQLVKNGLKEFGFIYSPSTSESDIENFEMVYLHKGNIFLIMDTFQGELIATGALIKDNSINYFKIRKMYVAKDHRGLGYGKLMLERLIELAKSKQEKVFNIVLETSNYMKSAINLYRNYGFNEVKIKPKSPRCDITMIKKI
jgi:ribosomal protein S18 acetylase RimI-like enzyme